MTDKEWKDMWEQAKHIENIAINMNSPRGTMIMVEVNKIKKAIEHHIGPQE